MILIDEAPSSSSLLSYPPLDRIGLKSRLPSPPNSDTRADACFLANGPAGTFRMGIEVKQVTELAGSLRSGRLQATQIPGLLSIYDMSWLLVITGSHRQGPKGELQVLKQAPQSLHSPSEKVWTTFEIGGSPVQYSYVHRFLVSPEFLSTGIRAWSVFNLREAAAWIGELYYEWTKPYSSHSSMRVVDRSGPSASFALEPRASNLHNPKLQDPRFTQRVKTAASLPHIGYERAVAMAEEFESVQEMISPECWCNRFWDEEVRRREEERWAGVQTVDRASGKKRKVGKSIAKQIGEGVR